MSSNTKSIANKTLVIVIGRGSGYRQPHILWSSNSYILKTRLWESAADLSINTPHIERLYVLCVTTSYWSVHLLLYVWPTTAKRLHYKYCDSDGSITLVFWTWTGVHWEFWILVNFNSQWKNQMDLLTVKQASPLFSNALNQTSHWIIAANRQVQVLSRTCNIKLYRNSTSKINWFPPFELWRKQPVI